MISHPVFMVFPLRFPPHAGRTRIRAWKVKVKGTLGRLVCRQVRQCG